VYVMENRLGNTLQTEQRPRVLVLGSTGRTGKAVLAELEKADRIQPVYASRRRELVQAWKHEGKDAVYLDLDDARTFPEALVGIDHLFLSSGYTVAMVHQGRTISDAAADAGVKFIVHLGIFGNGRMTDPHFAWHEIVERYIEGSGVAWAHLHPHVFMDNLLTTMPIVDGKFVWYAGDKPVGWVAPEDLAAVAALVLIEGPEKHGGKQYWLSTEVLNGAEAAAAISQGLGQRVEAVVLTPQDLLQQVESGSIQMPPNIDVNYGASMLEWLQQTFDGRMDFAAVTTTTVEDLTGRKPLRLRDWVRDNRERVIEAGLSVADSIRTTSER
jgi:NAD(P)H dehydrogenase (quinone)